MAVLSDTSIHEKGTVQDVGGEIHLNNDILQFPRKHQNVRNYY